MVSRFDYVHVFNVYARKRHPPTHLVWLVIVLGLACKSFELLLVLLAFGYVISGLIYGQIRRRASTPPPHSDDRPADRNNGFPRQADI